MGRGLGVYVEIRSESSFPLSHDTGLPHNPIVIINGTDIVLPYLKKVNREIRVYNNRLDSLANPYFLRAIHTSSTGYTYVERYWMKKIWDEKRGRMGERYIGTEIPKDDPLIENLPPLPDNILNGFVFQVLHGSVVCSEEMYNRFFYFFRDKPVTALRIQQ